MDTIGGSRFANVKDAVTVLQVLLHLDTFFESNLS